MHGTFTVYTNYRAVKFCFHTQQANPLLNVLYLLLLVDSRIKIDELNVPAPSAVSAAAKIIGAKVASFPIGAERTFIFEGFFFL